MSLQSSARAVFIVPVVGWATMAVAALCLATQGRSFGPPIPWRFSVVGRATAWRVPTAGALVTPLAIGAAVLAVVALGHWLLPRAAHMPSPTLRRALTAAEVLVAILAIETALMPLVGARPVVLTALFSLPIALIALGRADLADDARRRREYRALIADERHWGGKIVYVGVANDAHRMKKR